MGTGLWSDLGVGKSFLGPGVGKYNLNWEFNGPQIKFGNQRKTTNAEIEKTYEPGPGSYQIPGTVGNIPKYIWKAMEVSSNRSRSKK